MGHSGSVVRICDHRVVETMRVILLKTRSKSRWRPTLRPCSCRGPGRLFRASARPVHRSHWPLGSITKPATSPPFPLHPRPGYAAAIAAGGMIDAAAAVHCGAGGHGSVAACGAGTAAGEAGDWVSSRSDIGGNFSPVFHLFSVAWQKWATWKEGIWRSNTVGRKVKTIACQPLPPI